LAFTGFALKYPDSWLAWILGGETLRLWTHRLSGVALLAVGVAHIGYVLFTRDGRQLLVDLLPRKQDMTDFIVNLRYLFGRGTRKPRFARFGYIEKAEYWAVVWGTIIMGVTGLMIWLKIDVTTYFPRWAVDVATTVHYYEAILACTAIVVWHFYHVMFDPDIYPISWAWWDGKVDAHWYAEEHPLDAERLGIEVPPHNGGSHDQALVAAANPESVALPPSSRSGSSTGGNGNRRGNGHS
jgi:cytochrome b subunit of formate dehydrogenase